MHRSARILAAFLLLSGMDSSGTTLDIDVGGRPIAVPLPDGFTALTPDMGPYYEVMQAYTSPTNNRYLSLIPGDQAEALSTGNTVEFVRYINVESEVDANSTAEVKPAIERTNSRGIDWGEVLKKALIGGLIGGLIGLVGMLFWRRTY